MSARILIYDLSGANRICYEAMQQQITRLVDENQYCLEPFSKSQNALDDVRSNSLALVVVGGGVSYEMIADLAPYASKIHDYVMENKGKFMGICAGAIVASKRPPLTFSGPLVRHQNNSIKQMSVISDFKGKNMPLGLYTGSCCVMNMQECYPHRFGAPRVLGVGSESDQNYPLYFHSGVTFPSSKDEPGTCPLLEYVGYKFSGSFFDFQRPTPQSQPLKLDEKYTNISSVAAVTQEIGNGKILLSGVHPEIGSDIAGKIPCDNDISARLHQSTVVETLKSSKEAQEETMRRFLNTLSIVTKKV